MKTSSANLSAKYGFKFLKTKKWKKSVSERKGIKAMKKHVQNTGKLNHSRVIFLHSLNEEKLYKVLENNVNTATHGLN